MSYLINELINNKAVYRTAPATPGLLIMSVHSGGANVTIWPLTPLAAIVNICQSPLHN